MSMKLDEYSINLKEEEIKCGGFFANGGLPKGFSEAKRQDLEAINEKIPDAKINDNASLIKISKKSSFRGKAIPEFEKFNQLFGQEKTGKRLHFLKASFLKTDDDTIYTYSEHRPPMLLLGDFYEYYNIDFGQKTNDEIIKWLINADNKQKINDFTKLINIVYVICKILKKYFEDPDGNLKKKYRKKQAPYIYSKVFINFIDNEIHSTKDKIISREYTENPFINDDNDYVPNESKEKHENLKIFDISTLLQSLPEATTAFQNTGIHRLNLPNEIIRTLVNLSTLLNETLNTILDPNIFTHKSSNSDDDMDVNIQNYQYLADALFITSLTTDEYKTQDNQSKVGVFITKFNTGPLAKCIEIVHDFRDAIKTLTQELNTISVSMVNKLDILKYVFEDLMKQSKKISVSITIDDSPEISEYFKANKLIVKDLQKSQTTRSEARAENKRKKEEDMRKIADKDKEQIGQIAKLKKAVESGKSVNAANIIVISNELNEYHGDAVNKLKAFITLYNNNAVIYNEELEEIKTYIDNTYKAQDSDDILKIYEGLSYLEKAKPLLIKIKELQTENATTNEDYLFLLKKSNEKIAEYELRLAELTGENVDSKKIEKHNFPIMNVKPDEYSESNIAHLELKLKEMVTSIDAEKEKEREIEREREIEIERERKRRETDELFTKAKTEKNDLRRTKSHAGAGGNNTKELRKKLNTMSIKQLKRLSDKKYIEYGNKNTIKSLINNYMKHI